MKKIAEKMPLRVLFIGNSATYVHDIPGSLKALSERAGFSLECDSIVEGGAKLSFHADVQTEHGRRVLEAIKSGYDVVFLQDNGNCISSPELKLESQSATRKLAAAIHAAGARLGIYFRPPYGYEKWGFDPYHQCAEIDAHFLAATEGLDGLNVFVNRAFAYAIKNTGFRLWGEDNAHTNEYGAYLAVCVFFVSLFGVSAKLLDTCDLPEEDALTLQAIADKIALYGEMPW